ncbi:MAG: conjugal transfer protein TraN [Sulfurimonas sp.]
MREKELKKLNKLLIMVAYIVTLFTPLHALNCGQFGVFTQHNGHYYTTTKDRLTFEYAKTFAELGNGYLAIPNDSAENEFLGGLILGNQFAWIGIYDPSLSNNYCYETGSCSYDSSRFKTIKNGMLSFSNWGANQPDNLLKTSDVGQLTEITPLGEHWVALDSVNFKWYDFGNHNDQYNNPVKFLAIYEFDSLPECFHDDNTSELVDLHCNTAVSSTNGLTSNSGQLLQCQTDENGVPFCPASLAACQNTQNTNDGYSQEHTMPTTTRNSLKCPNGGNLSGTTCNVPASSYSATSANSTLYSNGSATANTTTSYSCPTNTTLNTTYNYCYVSGLTMSSSNSVSGIYQLALGRAPDIGGYNNWKTFFSVPITQSQANSFLTSAKTNSEKICGISMSTSKQIEIATMYIWYIGRCPDSGGWTNWNAGSNYTEAAFKTAAAGECTSVGGCPHPPVLSNSCPTGTFYNSSYNTCTATPTTTQQNTGTYSYSCLSGYTRTTASGTSSTPPANNCSKATTTYSCPNGGTLSGVTCNISASSYTATCPTGTNLPSDCSGSYPNTWLKGMYTGLLNRCPDQAGYNNWLNYISTYGITEQSQLQPTFCTAASRNNEPCGSATPSATTCYGTEMTNYYTYHCNADTNVYSETFVPQNAGGESSTSSTPPTNNCVQQNYVCNSNPNQTCADVGGVWQCSEHPCVDANDMEHTDTEVGSQDGDDDGWNQSTGACEGQLYLFGGTSGACRSWDLFGNFVTGTAVVGTAGIVAALDDSNCCSDDAVLFGLISCRAEEKLLAEKKKAGNCHYIGEFCSRRINLGFTRICVQKKKSSCCFNSKLAKIINEQGREQLNRGWGSASNPECKGFTPEEFQRLDMSRIDFSEFIESFQLPDMQNIGDSIRNRVTSNLSVSFPQQ